MNQAALISVIVPVYKVEHYLDRCLESIVNQTYHNLDIILIADGSPDHSHEMCDAWAKKDNRIRVIQKVNGGLSDARNAGMKIAVGEFISFVDSDDWIAFEMYEKLMAAIQKDKSDIAACAVIMIWEDGSPAQMLTVQINRVLSREEAQLSLLKEDILKQPVWYKMYRSKVITGIPFLIGKYHEDVFWSYQAIGSAKRVSIIDYIGYYYWQRTESIMGEKYSLKRLDAVEAKIRRQEYLEIAFPQLVSTGKIDIQWTCLYHGQKSILHLTGKEKQCLLNKLEEISKRFPLTIKDIKKQKLTQQCWLIFEKINYKLCCSLRNAFRVGI